VLRGLILILILHLGRVNRRLGGSQREGVWGVFRGIILLLTLHVGVVAPMLAWALVRERGLGGCFDGQYSF